MLGAANQWFSVDAGSAGAAPRRGRVGRRPRYRCSQALPTRRILDAVTGARVSCPDVPHARRRCRRRRTSSTTSPTTCCGRRSSSPAVTRTPSARGTRPRRTDPRTILAPEWAVLTDEKKYTRHSGSADFRAVRREVAGLPGRSGRRRWSRSRGSRRSTPSSASPGSTRSIASTTRRPGSRRLVRDGRPTWVPATEDRGEGVFLQFDEDHVAAWEAQVLELPVWEAFREAHEINFRRRTSKTAGDIDPDSRFPAPAVLGHPHARRTC